MSFLACLLKWSVYSKTRLVSDVEAVEKSKETPDQK